MTAYSIATHSVKDFETWKTVFDQFEPVRQKSGERSAVVLRHLGTRMPSTWCLLSTHGTP